MTENTTQPKPRHHHTNFGKYYCTDATSMTTTVRTYLPMPGCPGCEAALSAPEPPAEGGQEA